MHELSRGRGATLRLGGGGGETLVTQYWGGTKHFFLLILYNFRNIGGSRAPPPPPTAPTPRSLFSELVLARVALLFQSAAESARISVVTVVEGKVDVRACLGPLHLNLSEQVLLG